jgi:hypothetical protein
MLKTIKQARAALSMLNPHEVRRQADRPVHFGLVASSDASYRAMEDFLSPANGRQLQVHRADGHSVPEKVDVVLYEPGVVDPDGGYTFDPNDTDSWTGAILHDHDDLALALANQFPAAFRARVVGRTIHEIARENAIFALATAMPNVVPNFIELPWAIGEFASDTTFLTANQVRMAFLIAAASGREPGFKGQIGSVATIAGGAFGWRALARELVGKIPLGGGLIPKAAIAYAGTYVVGKGLEHFYKSNRPLTRAQRKLAYREAYERGKDVAVELRRESK